MSQSKPNEEPLTYSQLVENYREALKRTDQEATKCAEEAYDAILEYQCKHFVTDEPIFVQEA